MYATTGSLESLSRPSTSSSDYGMKVPTFPSCSCTDQDNQISINPYFLTKSYKYLPTRMTVHDTSDFFSKCTLTGSRGYTTCSFSSWCYSEQKGRTLKMLITMVKLKRCWQLGRFAAKSDLRRSVPANDPPLSAWLIIPRYRGVEWSSHNVVQDRLSSCKTCTIHTQIKTSTYRSSRGVSHTVLLYRTRRQHEWFT
ncbi:uncharacterized protein H6S33_001946 [Morchella sextelata]|uniref:uncharacterized protein n=1 Tax=Morchella sextelata TaxID=1174677 RepID=UPI001D03CB71|nr:uncharacterized protein H6S33_001946 [Morchella sextelata]KAH0607894.1 hypothetical protein H6S33_001946 [Morchella sextelata]